MLRRLPPSRRNLHTKWNTWKQAAKQHEPKREPSRPPCMFCVGLELGWDCVSTRDRGCEPMRCMRAGCRLRISGWPVDCDLTPLCYYSSLRREQPLNGSSQLLASEWNARAATAWSRLDSGASATRLACGRRSSRVVSKLVAFGGILRRSVSALLAVAENGGTQARLITVRTNCRATCTKSITVRKLHGS